MLSIGSCIKIILHTRSQRINCVQHSKINIKSLIWWNHVFVPQQRSLPCIARSGFTVQKERQAQATFVAQKQCSAYVQEISREYQQCVFLNVKFFLVQHDVIEQNYLRRVVETRTVLLLAGQKHTSFRITYPLRYSFPGFPCI